MRLLKLTDVLKEQVSALLIPMKFTSYKLLVYPIISNN